jgi:hypothetical protein
MIETSGSTRVDLEPAPEGFFGRMDVWSFGESRIFTATSSGVSMVRDSKAARGAASPEAVAIAVHGVGTGRHETGTRRAWLAGLASAVGTRSPLSRPVDSGFWARNRPQTPVVR